MNFKQKSINKGLKIEIEVSFPFFQNKSNFMFTGTQDKIM